jgi:hypothetical protein
MRQPRITHAKSKAGKHFRGLQSLTLSETSWGFLSSDIRDILSNLVTVKDLKLHRSNFDTIHQAVEFICAFPALQSLSFKDSILVPNVDMHRFLTTAPRLSHSYPLHIYLDCLNLDRPKSILYLIEWLVVQEPSPLIQLDTLRLGPLRDRSLLPSLCIHKLMRMSDLPLARLQIKAPQFPYSAQESDGTCFP